MTLHEIGLKHGTDKAYAHHYCDFYEKNLPGRNFNGRLLEIGVKDGASLKMWREYYPEALIVGIDINNPIEVGGCLVLKIDATDVYDLYCLLHGLPFDIVIDDGSHMTKDQQITFNYIFHSHMQKGGFYVMEDVHTSFYSEYINSKRTTYDILTKNYRDYLLFQRIPGDTSDSNTIIIRK